MKGNMLVLDKCTGSPALWYRYAKQVSTPVFSDRGYPWSPDCYSPGHTRCQADTQAESLPDSVYVAWCRRMLRMVQNTVIQEPESMRLACLCRQKDYRVY